MSKVTKSSSCVFNDLNVSHQNPCDELETVAYYRVNRTHLTHIPHKGYDGLVTRQNAEELLAAERMKLEATTRVGLQLSEELDRLKAELAEALRGNRYAQLERIAVQRAEKAEADNAALTMRVKELEGEVFYDQVLGITWKQVCEQCNRECAHYQQNAEAAEADNKRLREALEDISRGETTTYDEDVGTDVSTLLDEEEMQSIARAALGEGKL